MAIDWDTDVLSATMAVFGEDRPCRYMPAIGAPFDLTNAVFDEQSAELEVEGDLTSATVRRPVLGVRLSLFTAALAVPPAQGDRVLIRSVPKVFMVADVRPDGHGHAKLLLQDAADQDVA
jgi:hypothetical protein